MAEKEPKFDNPSKENKFGMEQTKVEQLIETEIREREYVISGKNLTPDDIEKCRDRLRERRENSLKLLEGEFNKTPEEISFINKVNSYLNEEIKELRINKKISILPEQIHLLSHEVFLKRFPKTKFTAFTKSKDQVVYIDKSAEKNRLELYKTILHEAIHLASYSEYHFDANQRVLSDKRLGYSIYDPKEKSREYFREFNEGVTEKLTQEIFKKHKELIKELNIKSAEKRMPIKWGHDHIDFLNAVVNKIAKKNNEENDTVWQRFKGGMFTGKTKHLGEIEQAFGRGSLKTAAIFSPDAPEKVQELKRFFGEEVAEIRKPEIEIARKLLEKLAKEKTKEYDCLQLGEEKIYIEETVENKQEREGATEITNLIQKEKVEERLKKN